MKKSNKIKKQKRQTKDLSQKGKKLANVSKDDPFGSYTGVAIDGGKPVQDVDDL